MYLAVIAIPVYKVIPAADEVVSFRQCIKVLGKHPFRLITYQELDLSYYTSLLKEAGISFDIEYFDKANFASLDGYNKLMISVDFYKRFQLFEYIYLYQLDCYVFTDELEAWCKKGFDYIGAPWINENLYRWLFIKDAYPFFLRMFHRVTRGKFLNNVGNGGLSLRKTSAMIRNLQVFSLPAAKWIANEDIFLCHFVAVFNRFFRLPNEKVALQFAFDIYPEVAFELNNRQLPFGCHAFNRMDAPNYAGSRKFWKKYIPELENL